MSHELTSKQVRSNILRQGTKILSSLVEMYESGALDSDQQSLLWVQLMALVAEGKVQGSVSEDDGRVKWSLTESYEKELNELRKALSEKNVVAGPWVMQ